MKSFLKMFSAACLLGATLIFSGCGDDDNNSAAPVTPPGSDITVNVPATGGSVTDAGSGVKTAYTFPAGVYNYSIAGFSAGDKLIFPAGSTTPTVKNTSWNDGVVVIESSLDNQTITVTLTGQAANDSNLNSIADINTVFGAGTI